MSRTIVQMSWSVDQAATENRNMSVEVRSQTEEGRRQAEDGVRELSNEEKSKGRVERWVANSQRDTYRHR